MITHVVDARAILAHYFHKDGAERVNALFMDEKVTVGISALSLTELKVQLLGEIPTQQSSALADAEKAFRLYADELLSTLPITREISEHAAELLLHSPGHLQPSEAIVAATAVLQSATLVHKSPSIAQIRLRSLKKIDL